MQRRRLILAWAMCAAWMAVIFVMSAMPGDVSGVQSGTVVRVLVAVYDAVSDGPPPSARTVDTLDLVVRKCAHMAEYAVLALLFCHALRLSGARRPAIYALALCVAYAATDEFHQSFVDARGPSPIDVMIDAAGATIALILRRILYRAKRGRVKGTGACRRQWRQ